MDWEAAFVERQLRGSQRILNVGCGIGSLEERMPHLNMVGLDSSASMLAEARQRSGKPFVRGQAEKLPFQKGSFDAALAVTTLEFLDDYRKALSEIHRVLIPNGKLIVMVLNPDSSYFKAQARRKDAYFRRIRHADVKKIEKDIRRLFRARGKYALGIKGTDVFESGRKAHAALFIVKGIKSSGRATP